MQVNKSMPTITGQTEVLAALSWIFFLSGAMTKSTLLSASGLDNNPPSTCAVTS